MKKQNENDEFTKLDEQFKELFERSNVLCEMMRRFGGRQQWFIASELENEISEAQMLLSYLLKLALKDDKDTRKHITRLVAMIRDDASHFFENGRSDPFMQMCLHAWPETSFLPWMCFQTFSEDSILRGLRIPDFGETYYLFDQIFATIHSLGVTIYKCALNFDLLVAKTISTEGYRDGLLLLTQEIPFQLTRLSWAEGKLRERVGE